MEECGEQREKGLTERLTTSSILGVILGVYIVYVCMCVYKCLQSECGAVRVSRVLQTVR